MTDVDLGFGITCGARGHSWRMRSYSWVWFVLVRQQTNEHKQHNKDNVPDGKRECANWTVVADFTSTTSISYCNFPFSIMHLWPRLYVDVFKWNCCATCVMRWPGVTAPVWPCARDRKKKKQHICLNNVKTKGKERRGKQVSQLLVSSHGGGVKHFPGEYMKRDGEKKGK